MLTIKSFISVSFIGLALASHYNGYDKMLQEVNKVRAQNNQKPLCNSEKIMNSALKHSQHQARTKNMTHDAPYASGSGLTARFTDAGFKANASAENVAFTHDQDVSKVMASWMKSPGHKQNILGGKFTHFGSAMVKGADNRYYWTQQFAGTSGNEPCMSGSPSSPPSQSQEGQTPTEQPQQPQKPQQPKEPQQPENKEPEQEEQEPQYNPTDYPPMPDIQQPRPMPGSFNHKRPRRVCLSEGCWTVTRNDIGINFIAAPRRGYRSKSGEKNGKENDDTDDSYDSYGSIL